MVGGNPGGCCTTFGSVGLLFYGAIPMRMQCLLRVSYLHMTGRSNLSWKANLCLGRVRLFLATDLLCPAAFRLGNHRSVR
jgi:hypothetical protein